MDNHELNPTDLSGWTPLIRNASLSGNRDVAELLLKFKSSINTLDNENKSALMIAVIKGNAPLVKVLVEYGADINVTNEYGKTPYDLAVAMDRRVIQICLLLFFFNITNYLNYF